MTRPIPDLAEAHPAPTLRVRQPSLAVTMPMTMLLVDYALSFKAMPTPELTALAEQLPSDVVDASWPVRASMAHGAVLRPLLLHQLPADHPGHDDWPALRSWIAGWSDGFVHGVVDFGVDSVMHYEAPPRDPEPTTADIIELPGPSETARRDGAEVLRWWDVPDPEERAGELLDARGFKRSLLALLDEIWELWLARVWPAELPRLRATVAAAPPPPPGIGPVQWITLVSGLRPDDEYSRIAERASDVAVVPSPGLGRSLSVFSETTTYFVYTPQSTGSQPDSDRPGIAIGRLADLATAMTALGERTRLAIVLHLLDRGPLLMQQIADALDVHQSTISRQVNALRKAGIVGVQSDRRVSVDRAAVRRTCETLLAALD
ncbi:MAG: ArsR/SmtB family transcription factor [Mycobacteriales bacterium]